MCPFIFNEIAHFCLIEIGTKMPSEISKRTGLAEQSACPCPIEPEQTTGMDRRKERISRFQLFKLTIKGYFLKITARQRCGMGPRSTFFAQVMLNLLKHMLSQPACGGQLATKHIDQRRCSLRRIFF
ncbi:hypothetical protein D9M69_563560 [compost metagenome]